MYPQQNILRHKKTKARLTRLLRHLAWKWNGPIENESVLIQLAQCWCPGLAISNAEI